MPARLHGVKDHGVMPWTTTHDPGEFLAAAGGFVRSRLVEHNVILSITARLPRAGRPGPGEPPLPDTLVPPLLGIGAQAGAAWRFARRWQVRTGASASVHRRQRLYRLGQLAPADPPPPGPSGVPVSMATRLPPGRRPAHPHLHLIFPGACAAQVPG
jgi:hypothetical protein